MKIFMKFMFALAVIMVIYGWIIQWPKSLLYSIILLLFGIVPALTVAIYKGDIKILPE